MSDAAQVRNMVDNVLEIFCQLDILVCNAGISWEGLLTEMTEEEWRRVFAVNVDGVFHCCAAALPHFIHGKAGKIITVSSMWGQAGASCEVAYSAAKAAVIGFSKALAKEVGPSGNHGELCGSGSHRHGDECPSIPPGPERAAGGDPAGADRDGRDVAESILFLASEGADFSHGQVLCPNGGLVI